MRLDPEAVTGSLGRLVAYAQNGLEVLRFGGLDTGEEPSPFEIVERTPMFRLRRYFPDTDRSQARPPLLLVHPMMLSADVWDVSPASSAVTSLHEAGVDPWVVDFGSPDKETGGLDRTLTDHVIAVSDIVELIARHTGQDVHIAGYSQGGMFCYQAAAYRQSRDIASVITFGSPADILAGTPLGLPEEVLTKSAEFLADHVFSRLALPGWAARTGFKLLDPVKSARSQVDFLRQLHNRDALLGREKQRRFLEGEGFVAWSGPAIVELLRQFVVHNRMMTGGFVIGDRLVTLADITCPILAFVGEVDDIGQPAAVRGVGRAAPKAEVFEYSLRAGHFGLVVGSTASKLTWPGVVDWIRWREGDAPQPAGVRPLAEGVAQAPSTDVSSRLTYGLSQLADVGLGASRGIISRANEALRTSREITAEAVHALPRLFRLGHIQGHTRVSFGKLLDEQARSAPDEECFLFDDRVHTNAAVGTRIDNVVRGLIDVGVRQGDHVGVLMETRPSALVAIAALSRLGAVAVLLPPVADLSTAVRLGEVTEIIVDPTHVQQAAATGCQVLVLGGGGAERDIDAEAGVDVIDMERIDPDAVELTGWYRPNPGLARDLAFILFTNSGGHTEAKLITNHRWALSAFGTASAAALTRGDTVYCITPLHHPSGLLTSVGGAVAGGSRIALSRGFDPGLFDAEVHRYGVTVVSYTWTLLRELVERPVPPGGDPHRPIRLFMGSGMPRGLWSRVLERFAPARVLEFYASTEGDAVLANLSGAKAGAKGRPMPGSAEVRLARFDPVGGKLIQDPRGFAVECAAGEVGLLLANPRVGVDPTQRRLRGVFDAGDTWVATDDLFFCDEDGDYWLVDNKHAVIHAAQGPVYTQPICDALADLSSVDLAVAYGVPGADTMDDEVAVAAVTAWQASDVKAGEVSKVLAALPRERRPDVVHVVDEIPVATWYRPNAAKLRAAGLPAAGERTWYYDVNQDAYLPLTEAARERLGG
ncbi:MAG: AMP-binding protein [Actinophytocola sp.]|nr:AMP-binding protein [Actinophytocola sp.]